MNISEKLLCFDRLQTCPTEALIMDLCPAMGQLESLRTLLPGAVFHGADDIGFQGCACDSRNVKPGDLFIAIQGESTDGLAHLSEAVERGCAAAVVDRPIEDFRIPTIVVPNARAAHASLCQHLAGNPSRVMKVIGVTGTNGKTTTACLIAGVLNHAGNKAGLLGSLGYFDGEDVEDPTDANPSPEKLASVLARMVRNGCTHAVMEVSADAIEKSRIAGVSYDAVCLTNITHDHLDAANIQNYRRAKRRIFEYLSPEGFAVVNADDPVASEILNTHQGPALTIGIEKAAEIMGMPLEQCVSEQTFLLTAGCDTLPVRTQMIGTHHIYNCLTAAAVGLAYGLELPQIVRSIESAAHLPGRLERIECGQSFGVFVDFAQTPDALKKTLQTLRSVTSGRVICVFGAGGERDRAKRPRMGQIAEKFADLAIVTSDNPRREDPMSILIDILKGYSDAEHAELIPDRGEAIRQALELAHPGDCVLIAGRGDERFQVVGDESIEFDDREVAKDWLYRCGE
jgi:UDP-N-acetylmuramoyl-L-alanyl-D-glutamate--2,6-diaminopimelate ligase